MTRRGAYLTASMFSLAVWLSVFAGCAARDDVGKYTKALEVLL